MIVLTYLLFFLACILSFYIPGSILVTKLSKNISSTTHIFLSFITGSAFFIFITYLTAYLKMPYIYPLLLIPLNIRYISKKYKKPKEIIKSLDYPSLGIILTGTLLLLLLDFFSGLQTKNGLQFLGTNSVDGVIHVANIRTMTNIFPPERPSLAGIATRGYHYFYPFLLSRFELFYRFNSLDLLFRLFPLYISMIYGCSFYVFSQKMKLARIQTRGVLAAAYIVHSFLPLFSSSELLYTGIVDPIGLIHNPGIMLGITFMLTALSLIPEIKTSLYTGAVIALLLGVASQTKIYTGIVGIASLVMYTLISLKRFSVQSLKNLSLTILFTGIITGITYLPSNWGEGNLVWAPFLYYEHFMTQHMFDPWHWYLKKVIFVEHYNIPRLILLYLQAIGLFWALSIGSRIIILLKTKNMLKKSFWTHEYNIILISALAISIIIPSLFIQSFGVFDIGQFLWIAVSLLSIPTGIAMADMLVSKNFLLVKIIILAVFLTPGILGYSQDFKSNVINPPGLVISNNDIAVFKSVESNMNPLEHLVYVPEKDYKYEFVWPKPPLASAMTGRGVYYEHSGTPIDFKGEDTKRLKILYGLWEDIYACRLGNVQETLKRTIQTSHLVTERQLNCLNQEEYLTQVKIGDKFNYYKLK